jgi:hypothetical protein
MIRKLAFLGLLGFGFALLLSGCQTCPHKSSYAKDCSKPSCAAKCEHKTACDKDSTQACSAVKSEAKAACGKDCKKPCCADKSEAKAACKACGAEKGSAACKTNCATT